MNPPSTCGWAALTALVAVSPSLPGCSRGTEPAPPEPPSVVEAPVGDPRLPGVTRVDEALQARLDEALARRGPSYAPRARHLRTDGSPRFTNRLIEASSPYLLQHAHNPVSWYPWSEEAFARARLQNKPIFLSIGYSTCHWCHVMERESFEDEEIAAFLNRHFIAIKVDREERPDVDSVYMTAVNVLSGRGGWPMTLLLTPHKEPFFGGTYFPPRRGVRGARVGLIDLLGDLLARFVQDPEGVAARAQEISQRVEQISHVAPGAGVPSDRDLVSAVGRIAASFDPEHGGFGGAPKFPEPSRLALLLRYARRTRDGGATSIVTTTLDAMSNGGIYDQVGGGFHRYATDAEWRLPHFEKMLYDNAQLAVLYLEAWQHTGHARYRTIVREVLDYVLREMTSESGGFYSATDADSLAPGGHQEEGRFFTWTPEELVDVLGEDTAALVADAFGVTEQGNLDGRSVLHRPHDVRQLAKAHGLRPSRVETVIDEARATLLEARLQRPPPLLDDKVIAAWNGLMISAFARAGWELGDADYVLTAARAAKNVLRTMRSEGGGLVRTVRGGERGGAGFLDDYAFMVQASLDLYETTAYLGWLDAALELQAAQDARFLDPDAGGYFLTPKGGEALLVREKPTYDGAVPSGNAIAARNLLRLHDLTGEPRWKEAAERLFSSVATRLERMPTASPMLLVALDRYYDVPLEVVILVDDDPKAGVPLAARARRIFLPNKSMLYLRDVEAERQAARVPWLSAKRALGGKPTAYVCERGRCELPTSSPAVFARQLDKRAPYPSFTNEALEPLPRFGAAR